MVDLHCHLMPYVDDGAMTMDVAEELLEMEVEQGVHTVCFTPHLRDEMFMTTDEKVWSCFERLQNLVAEKGLPLELYLSREYFYDRHFKRQLQARQVLPMGHRVKTLLVEFSYHDELEDILEAARVVLDAGYVPLFAHVERYLPFRQDPIGTATQLRELGVLLQVNAGGVLGRDGWPRKWICKRLLKNQLVDVVASDTHDPDYRRPNLDKCRLLLEKKYGRSYAWQLLHETPLGILQR